MKFTQEIEIDVPQVPNFLRVHGTDRSTPVGSLTDSQLKQIGEEWTQRLIERAQEQRKAL